MFTHVNILMFLLSPTVSTLNLFGGAANPTDEGIGFGKKYLKKAKVGVRKLERNIISTADGPIYAHPSVPPIGFRGKQGIDPTQPLLIRWLDSHCSSQICALLTDTSADQPQHAKEA